MKKRTLNILILLLITVLLILGGKYALTRLNWSFGQMTHIFSSAEEFRTFILSFGVWAPLVFFVAQTVQVIISPIPGNITGLVGGALFGWSTGFLLNGGGVLVGSILAFFMARLFGRSLVILFIGKETFDKYSQIFNTRFIFGLFLVFLFPFFPDDALCFLAGLSSLPFPVFMLLVILGRMPGMLIAALAGAGVFVFSIVQWVIVGIVSLVSIYFVIKYRNRLEHWLHRLVGLDPEKGH